MSNILMITAHFPPDIGGIQNTCLDIYGILSQDHHVQVLTRGYSETEKDPNIHRMGRMGLPLFNLYSIAPMIKLIRKNNVDLIISGSLNSSFAAGLAASITRIKCLSLAHGLDIIYPNILYQLAIKKAMRLLDSVSVNSRNTKQLLSRAGYDENRIRIIPPAIPDKHFDRLLESDTGTNAVTEKYGLSNKSVLLSVGRLVPRKGLLPFVKISLPLILKEISDCQLLIAGDNPKASSKGSEIHKIMAAARDLGIEDNINVLGFVDDEELLEVYQACDLFIFPVLDIPGDVEGFGIVAIEAALAGKPSLGTKAGGVPDAILDGRTGVLVDPGDYAAFAQASLDLLRNRSKMQEMGSAGKKRVMENFSVSILGPVWRNYIDEVLNQ
jgi:phosphatidylinositol alpha-1,6-mannosyltransferase